MKHTKSPQNHNSLFHQEAVDGLTKIEAFDNFQLIEMAGDEEASLSVVGEGVIGIAAPTNATTVAVLHFEPICGVLVTFEVQIGQTQCLH